MAARPWTISVLSTNYDLHEYRKAAIDELEEKNVTVSAYEHPDFPVEPDLHSHESCLVALDRADIVILIVDKRFGGAYHKDESNKISITQKEFYTAVSKGIPCFVFVSKGTWDERHSYKTQYKAWLQSHSYSDEQQKEGIPKKEFNEQYACTYVDSVQIIEFVDALQHILDEFDLSTNNWITSFNSIEDFIRKMQGKLCGISRYLLEMLVQVQRRKFGERHTSTGYLLSLNDVFSNHFYLEPSFSVESGTLLPGNTLDEQLQKTLCNGSSLLVYGEAGYGKTTVLAKSYFSHVEAFLQQDSYHIPFYLWLKKKTGNYHFSFNTYIAESFEDDLNKAPYPYLDLTNIHPYFYFDGFDEIAEKMSAEEIERISVSDMFRYPILLTCRQQYANRYINNYSFSDKFGVAVKIETWDQAKAQEYINNFCERKGKSHEFSDRVHKLLAENEELSDVLTSPLLVTMLLWIVDQNRMQIPETIRTRIQLFRSCIECLAKRELNRLGISESYAPWLILLWSFASWKVYFCKLAEIPAKLSCLTADLSKELPDLPFECSNALFECLFDSSNDEIFGTFHEQFLEYLVANILCLACKEKRDPYPIFLQHVMRPEINRYFRGLWNESTEKDKADIVDNLFSQYFENLIYESFQAVSTRVHAAYHICRFDSAKRKDFIKHALSSETHISVRLSLFFGAIKMGDLEREQQFFELLADKPEYNAANRGYHLAYYADAVMGETLPFEDDLHCNWQGTLNAILRHFRSGEDGHYFLRRIELVTMEHFIENRGAAGPLTKDVLNEFSELIDASPNKLRYPDFETKVKTAFESLKSKYDSVNLHTNAI